MTRTPFTAALLSLLAAGALAAAEFNTRESLRLAIQDLTATFGGRYPKGHEYLARLNAVTGPQELEALRSEALLANPLLDFDRLLLVREHGEHGVKERGVRPYKKE